MWTLLSSWKGPDAADGERFKTRKSACHCQNGKGQGERDKREIQVRIEHGDKRRDEEHSNYGRHDKNQNAERNDECFHCDVSARTSSPFSNPWASNASLRLRLSNRSFV